MLHRLLICSQSAGPPNSILPRSTPSPTMMFRHNFANYNRGGTTKGRRAARGCAPSTHFIKRGCALTIQRIPTFAIEQQQHGKASTTPTTNKTLSSSTRMSRSVGARVFRSSWEKKKKWPTNNSQRPFFFRFVSYYSLYRYIYIYICIKFNNYLTKFNSYK